MLHTYSGDASDNSGQTNDTISDLDPSQTDFSDSNRSEIDETFLSNSHDHWVAIYLAVILMVIIIVVGCAGNIMAILAVKTTRKLQTVSNIFVVNLSVCDLVFVSCVLPFNIYTYISDDWYLPNQLCKFVGFLGYTLTGTTIITITLIAFNRYKMVLDPGSYRNIFTPRKIVIMLLIAWLFPALILLPAVLEMWGKFGYVAMLVTCNLLLSHESQLFKLFLLMVRAGLPCALILYYYAMIYHTTRRSHQRLTRNSFSMLSSLGINNQRREMHLTRMMVIIFVVFILSYLPCTITGIIDWNTVLSKRFHMFCAISVYFGSAVNPLIYGLMNSQFRDAYIRIIICRKDLNSPTNKLPASAHQLTRDKAHHRLSLSTNLQLSKHKTLVDTDRSHGPKPPNTRLASSATVPSLLQNTRLDSWPSLQDVAVYYEETDSESPGKTSSRGKLVRNSSFGSTIQCYNKPKWSLFSEDSDSDVQ